MKQIGTRSESSFVNTFQTTASSLKYPVVIRHNLQPGDLGAIVQLHGTIYAREYGFDPTFEAYVAGPMAEFVRAGSPRDRLWIAEHDGRIAGSIAIVGVNQAEAQLRWYLVDPSARGSGLGKQLLHEAVQFSKDQDYSSIFLWTVAALKTAARLYLSFGFTKTEEQPGHLWGVNVVEERYVLELKD